MSRQRLLYLNTLIPPLGSTQLNFQLPIRRTNRELKRPEFFHIFPVILDILLVALHPVRTNE
ncbi:hypothetical protein BT96DRAFT_314409 [Gymnopus androsaceus JB14]|uniref:Uncharacterized protein n=1 Tax=Gymnopus androsaceus JB14 TaxID=1447944 RepID=A0A6A4I749_9AGAR|nr:hypothetical protein BT96DRAFT_314409 [Gymnopus androsaceus JB14]